MNANDATLTELVTVQTGSMVADTAPNVPASGSFDLVVAAVAGSALGSSGALFTLTISAIDLTTITQPWPVQTLHQAFDAANGWKLSGAGPDYQCTQTFPVPSPAAVPAGHWPATPAVRGLPGQPGRPDRLDHPQPPVRAHLDCASAWSSRLRPAKTATRPQRCAPKAQTPWRLPHPGPFG